MELPCSWVCPYCNQPTTITEEDVTEDYTKHLIENVDGAQALTCTFIVCPNPDCKKTTLSVELWAIQSKYPYNKLCSKKKWQLLPQSIAQSFPDYIPKALLDDYNEACLIKDLSPKASASLARRCLQGIIRDFWSDKVKPGRLANEIEQVKDEVDTMTWEAIDAVRSVGNIGAHMEKDVNLIVDIEPNEAKLLIQLIETLLRDWYIAREQRKSYLEALVKLGAAKKAARKAKQDKTSQ